MSSLQCASMDAKVVSRRFEFLHVFHHSQITQILGCQGVYGLQMRCQKRAAVLPMVQRHSSSSREEGRVSHTEETEQRAQIRLYEIERGELRLGIVNSASGDYERGLLAGEQSFPSCVRVRKGFAHAGDLIDPELQHGGDSATFTRATRTMHTDERQL
jgi:hypothetical protein